MAIESTGARTGRPGQRRRTRAAILDATMALLAAGTRPTLEEIAAGAEVSRRTIYMHFPTLDQLLIDASMGLLAGEEIDAKFPAAADATARVTTIADTLYDHADDWLPLGRRMVALTAEQPPVDRPKRGQRRVNWIERAIEPVAAQLNEEQHERLVSSLSVIFGWEAMIVFNDINGLAPKRQREVMIWMAQTLVDAAAAEAGQ